MARAGYTVHNYVANPGVGRWLEAGVLKKLSLAGYGIAVSGLVWPQPAIIDSETTIGWCTQPANSQLSPQSMTKYLGLARA